MLGKVEIANHGTLFLDEIGDMPMPLQSKLLRFLQERSFERLGGRAEITVDVRVICATHRNPDELIKAKLFREDLYYRLSELVINIPPLRQREGDAVLLAHFFVSAAHQSGRDIRGLAPDALSALTNYAWPGNVRELENRVKRAVIMAETNLITAADLDIPALAVGASPSPAHTLREAREVAERDAVNRALEKAEGNVSQAAKLLDVSRPTLYDLMRHHNIRA